MNSLSCLVLVCIFYCNTTSSATRIECNELPTIKWSPKLKDTFDKSTFWTMKYYTTSDYSNKLPIFIGEDGPVRTYFRWLGGEIITHALKNIGKDIWYYGNKIHVDDQQAIFQYNPEYTYGLLAPPLHSILEKHFGIPYSLSTEVAQMQNATKFALVEIDRYLIFQSCDRKIMWALLEDKVLQNLNEEDWNSSSSSSEIKIVHVINKIDQKIIDSMRRMLHQNYIKDARSNLKNTDISKYVGRLNKADKFIRSFLEDHY